MNPLIFFILAYESIYSTVSLSLCMYLLFKLDYSWGYLYSNQLYSFHFYVLFYSDDMLVKKLTRTHTSFCDIVPVVIILYEELRNIISVQFIFHHCHYYHRYYIYSDIDSEHFQDLSIIHIHIHS